MKLHEITNVKLLELDQTPFADALAKAAPFFKFSAVKAKAPASRTPQDVNARYVPIVSVTIGDAEVTAETLHKELKTKGEQEAALLSLQQAKNNAEVILLGRFGPGLKGLKNAELAATTNKHPDLARFVAALIKTPPAETPAMKAVMTSNTQMLLKAVTNVAASEKLVQDQIMKLKKLDPTGTPEKFSTEIITYIGVILVLIKRLDAVINEIMSWGATPLEMPEEPAVKPEAAKAPVSPAKKASEAGPAKMTVTI